MDLATLMSYGSMSAFTTIGEKPVQVIYVPFQIAGPTSYPQPPPYSSIPMPQSYGVKEELASPKRLTPSSSPEIDVGHSPSASELAAECPSPSYISLKRQASDVLAAASPVVKRPRKQVSPATPAISSASPSSSSTSEAPADSSSPTSGGRKVSQEDLHCKICGAPAMYQHYGALSCLACSAFFRRTVADRRSYVCKRRKGCGLTPTTESSCQSCRFQRCLVAGMVASEVLSMRGSRPAAASNSSLNHVASAYNGMQLEWVRVLIQSFGSYAKFIEFTKTQKPDIVFRENQLMKMEFEVLRQFLQSSDVLDARRYLRVDVDTVALRLLHAWNFAEIVFATARNVGGVTNKVHRLDELFVEANVESFTKYYAADSNIREPAELAKATVEKCAKVFDLAKRLRSLRLDDAETAAFYQLLLATFEPELFVSRDALLAYRNAVFANLAAHHRSTLTDFAVRCDYIVQFCGEMQEAIAKLNDYFVLVESHRMPEQKHVSY